MTVPIVTIALGTMLGAVISNSWWGFAVSAAASIVFAYLLDRGAS